MKGCFPSIIRCWSIVLSLFVMACASTPRVSESLFNKEHLTSRNGMLRYRLPTGWLNVTNDSIPSSSEIWVVRNDFAATLSVREVVIDAGTRSETRRAGMNRVAELMLALVSGEGGITVVTPPAESSLNGRRVSTYEYTSDGPGDRVHIILMDTGTKVYEVRMLMTKRIPMSASSESIALQEMFVQNLVW